MRPMLSSGGASARGCPPRGKVAPTPRADRAAEDRCLATGWHGCWPVVPAPERIRLVSAILLALVFLASGWRAATQAITLDEALTYQLYVDAPLAHLVLVYDANHHILHSLLCRASASLFGHGELALRLPSLLAGLAYLLLAQRITVGARATAWSLLAFALLATNPFVLDYLALARGYALALALLFAALAAWLRFLAGAGADTPRWRSLLLIGLLQAAALFANLAFVVPLLALALTAIALLLQLSPRGQRRAVL